MVRVVPAALSTGLSSIPLTTGSMKLLILGATGNMGQRPVSYTHLTLPTNREV